MASAYDTISLDAWLNQWNISVGTVRAVSTSDNQGDLLHIESTQTSAELRELEFSAAQQERRIKVDITICQILQEKTIDLQENPGIVKDFEIESQKMGNIDFAWVSYFSRETARCVAIIDINLRKMHSNCNSYVLS